MKCTDFKHPLVHNGAHQKFRVPDALLPENLKLDDRDTKAFLNFAYEYAALLKYVDVNNQVNGNWQCFFSGGFLGILSIVTSIDLGAIDDKYCRAELDFWRSIERASPEDLEAVRAEKYQVLIDCIYALAVKIDRLCKALPGQIGLKSEVLNFIDTDITRAIIENRFQNALRKLIAYDKANRPIIVNGDEDPYLEEKYKRFITSADNISACTKSWKIVNLEDFYCITPNDRYREPQDPNDCKENRILRNLFLIFFRVLSTIVRRADYYLQKELENNHAQEPQISLFIAFILLFRRLLNQFNTLTKSHLDFFYERVLCLPQNPLTPDQVFVVFELANVFDDFRLLEGMVLDAGKDSEGNKLEYTLDHELVVSKAVVEACDISYLQSTAGGWQSLYTISSPSTQGAKNEVLRWSDFRDSNLSNLEINEIGFAFSDPILKLGQGTTRFIVLTLQTEQSIGAIDDEFLEAVEIYVSSSEAVNGWLRIGTLNAELGGIVLPPVNDDNNPFANAYPDIASYYVQAQGQHVVIKILFSDDYFSIDVPDSPLRLFKNAKSPIFKVVLKDHLNTAFDFSAVTNLNVITESIGVTDGITLTTGDGQFSNHTKIPFLGYADADRPLGPDAFLSIQIDELSEKQIMGLQLTPKFILRTINPPPGQSQDDFLRDLLGFELFDADFQVLESPIKYDSKLAGFQELPFLANFKQLDQDVFLRTILRTPISQADLFFAGQANEFAFEVDPSGVIPVNPGEMGGGPIDVLGERSVLARDFLSSQGIFPGTPTYPWDASFSPLTSTQFNRGPGIDFFNSPLLVTGGSSPFLPGAPIPKIASTSQASIASFPHLPAVENIYSSRRNQNLLRLNYTGKVDGGTSTLEDIFANETAFISEVAARYIAFADFVYVDTSDNNNHVQYRKTDFIRYHIIGDGYNVLNPKSTDVPFLPEGHLVYPEDETASPDEAPPDNPFAYLDIGIKDLRPGEILSLLFRLEEGTGNTNYEPPVVEWYYLSKDEDGISDVWRPFRDGALLLDTTKTDPQAPTSLLQSGIIQIITSPRMTNQGTSKMPEAGLYWIRAVVKEIESGTRIIALPNILSIHAQAGLAEFKNNDNTLNQLEEGLPAETIAKLSNPVPAIKSVMQPLSSFGGRMPEDQFAYYRRVSERLRHKNRAINIWDYERLILERYPEVLQAKAISHTNRNCEIAPGNVTIAVFPDLMNRTDINPYTPGFSIGRLEGIEDHLRERSNLFLNCDEHIQIVNPAYEPIQVRCCVRFHPQFSPVFYASQLNEDLHGFLAPWIIDRTVQVHFSSELHPSTILNFIEEREYVDVVTNFEVVHFRLDPASNAPVSINGYNGDIPVPVEDGAVIRSETARSVFTTLPAGHEIKLWGDAGCDQCKAVDFTDESSC